MALSDNLISYYKLDESSGNAADSVGSNTATNTSVSYGTGKINNGGVFNGSSSFFTSAYSNSSSEFTHAFWFKFTSSTNNKTTTSQYSASKPNYWNFIARNNHPTFPKKLVCIVNGGDFIMYGTTDVDDGNWHFGTIVLKSGASALYVDGNSEASSSVSYTVPVSSMETFYIGKTGDNSDYANGMIDEVGIWSRALTSDEVEDLYNSGNGLEYPFETAYSLEVAVGAFTLTGIAATLKKALKIAGAVGAFTLTGIAATLKKALKIAGAVGEFTLTGIDIALQKGYGIAASVGQFILTGIDVIFKTTGWTKQTKNTSSWTKTTKNTDTWTKQTKNTSTWTKQ